MSQSHAPADPSKYYLPHGTPWPIIGSVALFSTILGVVAWLNDWFGPELFERGLALVAVMFIGAFFGALFYARTLSVPWIGGEGVKIFNKLYLWQNYDAGWPTNGPAHLGPRADGTFETIPAFGVPALNTAILLTSGVTITIAHHALRAGNRGVLKVFLALTFLLGFLFVTLQAHEYGEAYMHKGLTLGTGIYGSTFFMLTGFHG